MRILRRGVLACQLIFKTEVATSSLGYSDIVHPEQKSFHGIWMSGGAIADDGWVIIRSVGKQEQWTHADKPEKCLHASKR